MPLAQRERSHWVRLYGLPTRFGLYMGLVLLSLIALGLRVQNNMLLAVVALLAVLVFLSVIWGASNMHRLQVKVVPTTFPMAGLPSPLELRIDGPGHLYGVQLRSVGKQPCPNGKFRWTPTARGVQRVSGIRVESEFPLHLVRIWTTLLSPAIAVAPTPRPASDIGSKASATTLDSLFGDRQAQDSPTELRPYSPGDSLARIHWRRFAQRGQLLVRSSESQASRGQVDEIDYADFEHLGHEAALSALCFELLEADRQGRAWSLRLPGASFHSSQAKAKDLALHALALA